MIDLTTMPRDCDCSYHDGLCWLHEDRLQFELNLKIIAGYPANRVPVLQWHAFCEAEIRRLQEKQRHMRRYITADENETFIFPEGYRERDYNQRMKEVFKLR